MRVNCRCGKALNVADRLAGKRVRCPGCGQAVPVPDTVEPAEELEELPLASQRKKRPQPMPEEDDEEVARPRGKKSRPHLEDDEEQTARPRGKNGRKQVSFLARYGLPLGLVVAVVLVVAVALVFAYISGITGNTARTPGDTGKGGRPTAWKPPTMTPEVAQQKANELVEVVKNHQLSDTEFPKQSLALINALTQANQGEVAAPGLAALLKDAQLQLLVRTRAASSLGFLGPQAQKAMPQMLDALRDPEWRVRQGVAAALGWICSKGRGVQPTDTPMVVRALRPCLTAELYEDNEVNRQHSLLLPRVPLFTLQALSKMGPAAQEAVPDIIPMLRHQNQAARSNAASALGNIGGPEAGKAIPILRELQAADPSQEVRRNAGSALGKLQAQ